MLDNQFQNGELIRWATTTAFLAIMGMAGVAIGAWLTTRRERMQRRHAFVISQMRDLYSPLLAIRDEIRISRELRGRVFDATNQAWKDLCARARKRGGEEALEDLQIDRFPQFENVLKYDKRQFSEIILPAYQRMFTVFRDHMWLAEKETRPYFAKLSELVALSNRWVEKSIPIEAWDSVGYDEDWLQCLFDHLQEKHDDLQDKLRRGQL